VLSRELGGADLEAAQRAGDCVGGGTRLLERQHQVSEQRRPRLGPVGPGHRSDHDAHRGADAAVAVAQSGRQRGAHAGLLGLGQPRPVSVHEVLEHHRRQLPHLHAAARVEGEPQEAGGEAGLRAQLLHAQLACLAPRRVDDQVGLQRLVEGGEQARRSVFDVDERVHAHVDAARASAVLMKDGQLRT